MQSEEQPEVGHAWVERRMLRREEQCLQVPEAESRLQSYCETRTRLQVRENVGGLLVNKVDSLR